MIILGGIGHLRGAMLGALALTLLQELFQSEALFGSFAKHWQLMLGLAIIACVALMPNGLIGLVRMPRAADRAPRESGGWRVSAVIDSARRQRDRRRRCRRAARRQPTSRVTSAASRRSTTSRWRCAAARSTR